VQGGYPGTDIRYINPLFVDPVSYSSDPSTVTAGDYRLRYASPALDTDFNDPVSAPFDLDGNPSVADGDGDGTPEVNLGAYEWPAYVLTINQIGECDLSLLPDQDAYGNHEQVILTATADAGWLFKRWSGDITSTSSKKFC
jgi:Divergent InlB B-repeat domain